MATLPRDLDHYQLPSRIRNKKPLRGAASCRLALAEKISELAGRDAFCRIDNSGIVVQGLDEWDKHQVLRGGWGRLGRGYVLLHLPRDDEELEVCWNLLQRACHNQIDSSLPRSPLPAARWPRFSRTPLQ